MTKVLTVDDSRAVRMLVSKNARELGLEVDEAEDGQQGLAKMTSATFDLIILDVTMPVLDGPGMLAGLRARGDLTPVLMLTSESKRSVVSSLLKLGIADYILKPFQADELKAKIAKVLNMAAPEPGGSVMSQEVESRADSAAGSGTAAGASTASGSGSAAQSATGGDVKSSGGKHTVDILCIDDMENVSKRLRTMIPEQVTLATAVNAAAALAICRERVFRVILLDNDMPGLDSTSLMRQLRVMQPQAAFWMLSLRSVNKAQEAAREANFAGVIFKPFDQAALDDCLQRYFDNQELTTTVDNVITVAAFKGRENRLAGFFVQATTLISKQLEELAAACYGEAVVDVSQMPIIPEKTTRLVLQLSERSRKVGIEMRLVGSEELVRILKQVLETAEVRISASVAEAQTLGAP
jgi:DNA-binding response OmpR family regulator